MSGRPWRDPVLHSGGHSRKTNLGGGLNWCHGDTEEKTSVSFISRLSPICRKGLETRLDICVSIIEIQSSSDLDLYMTFVWE